ncbi:hypothetical protein MAPG_04884 [Magnaporthiopsis poae ATCC 64411]|uniref:Bifunctional cytochrome P450/NADPH--P450 reductase n=1 Tax=Magnaporthiopsis poae (strain ATCC 64411 / 73-15) TaxID=644358 RepID=A0A0C4DXX7_MAGP6|nr:hypothetical protein MAPG_04884 [Magnaporthiopsis poae ATCC 64411]
MTAPESEQCPVKRPTGRCPYERIPGPTAYPVIGSIPHLDLKAPFESMLAIQKRYGPIFQMIFAGKREISVCTRELTHEVCDETRWHKLVTSGISTLRQVVQDALFTAHHGSRQWGVTHRILKPIFGPLSIRSMFDEMKDCAEQLCLKWARHGPEERIDLAQDYTRLTLDTIALCMMDYRFNSFYRDGQHHPFVKHMVAILSEADIQSMLPDWAGVFRPRAMRKFKKDIQLITDLCGGMVEERRAHPVARRDFLNAMLKNADPETSETLNDDEVVRNLITFLVAGHETTSGMLSFATYYLLKHPETLARTQQEVDEVVGREQVTVSHIQKLPYLDAVFREALRLAPTAVAFYVTPYKPELLAGKYLVEPGEAVCCLLDPIHRDKTVYGADADEWKPERMMQDKFEALPANAWKPFGNGQRICLGMAFTWQESKLAMAMLLQNFGLSMHDPDYKLRIKHLLTIKPEGFYIKAKPRHGRTATDLHRELRGDSGHDRKDTNPRVGVDAGSKQITILYGSDTGTCEALANRLSSHLSLRGFSPTVATMDSTVGHLPSLIVFILGSYHGKPAGNAKQFMAWTETLQLGDLNDKQFAVLGCGHSDWTKTFYITPLLLDGRLAAAGAERLLDMGRINNAKDDAPLPSVSGLLSRDSHVRKSPRRESSDQPPGKRHIEILLPEDMAYDAGWHVQVMPANDDATIQHALSRYGLDSTTVVTVGSASGFKLDNVPVDVPIAASQLFAGRDLRRAICSPAVFDQLAKHAVDDAIRDQLAKIKASDLEATRRACSPSSPPSRIPRCPCRSPSSSRSSRACSRGYTPSPPGPSYLRAISPSQLPSNQLPAATTFSIVGQTASPTRGVGSNYLATLSASSPLHVSVQKGQQDASQLFRLPSSSTTPVIMIAAGTGIAPFVGFVQQRSLSSGATPDSALLLFGCKTPADDLYRAELDALSGVVTVDRAYSRATQDGKKYVTDLIGTRRDDLARLWVQGAVLFVCGAKKLADGVKNALAPVIFEADRHSLLVPASASSLYGGVAKRSFPPPLTFGRLPRSTPIKAIGDVRGRADAPRHIDQRPSEASSWPAVFAVDAFRAQSVRSFRAACLAFSRSLGRQLCLLQARASRLSWSRLSRFSPAGQLRTSRSTV